MNKSNTVGEFGLNVFFDGVEIELIQQPNCDVPQNSYWDYQAMGLDNKGNEYLIKWEMYDCYKNVDELLDDESNACNWDVYTIEQL